MQTQKFQRGKVLRTAKLLYTPICFFFIFYFAWTNKSLLHQLFKLTKLDLFLVSALIWGALHFLAPLGSKIVFMCLGVSTHYKQLLEIHISRLPARYLPGGIWHTVGRIKDYHSLGISKQNLTLLVAVETFFPCLTTFLLGGGYLWFSRSPSLFTNLAGVLALASTFVIVIIPFIARWKFTAYIANHFTSAYLLLLLVTLVYWLIASTSFLFYFSSVSPSSVQIPLPQVAATYIFSWGVGYISVFAPQGIGVFEVVAGKLMELPMTLGGAVAFLAGFRIVALIGDSVAWMSMRLINKQTSSGITHLLKR